MAYIIWEECLAKSANKRDVALEILDLFIHELPNVMQNIQISCNNFNHTMLSQIIHRFQGGCCYTGVPKLHEIAKQVMHDLKIDSPNLNTSIIDMLTMMSEVINEYQQIKGNL